MNAKAALKTASSTRINKYAFLQPDPTDNNFIQALAQVRQGLELAAKSPGGIWAGIVPVDPMLAKALLDSNYGNRNIRDHGAKKYMVDMLNGAWAMNGVPVIVAKDGSLNDGQHRLLALAMAGEEDPDIVIPMMITFGVDRETNKTVDSGMSRTDGDVFRWEGIKYSNITPSLCKTVISFERGDESSFGDHTTVTRQEAIQRSHDDPGGLIENAASFASANMRTYKDLKPTQLAFCYWLIVRRGGVTGEMFMESLACGTNVVPGSPVHAVRKWLAHSASKPQTKSNIEAKYEAVIRAWNAHNAGTSFSKVFINGKIPKVRR